MHHNRVGEFCVVSDKSIDDDANEHTRKSSTLFTNRQQSSFQNIHTYKPNHTLVDLTTSMSEISHQTSPIPFPFRSLSRAPKGGEGDARGRQEAARDGRPSSA
jgi:hypothetical protein